MRRPEFLKEGGVIGFVAPSFGCNISPYKEAFSNALAKFDAMGYKTKLGPNCYKGDGVGISTSPDACAAELMEYMSGDEADVLISCGGGELMCEILPYMDFDRLSKAKPKWFMGYSDNTNFTFLYTTCCDTMSIYGPCASTFGMSKWHESLHDAMGLLSGKKSSVGNYELFELESLKSPENPLAPYHVTQKTHLLCDEGHVAMEGRILGGCMDCLVTLLGTRYDKVSEFNRRYKDDGVIWYLESCDLNPFGIRRAMWQMREAGWFDMAKGFLIGRPYHYGEEMFGLDNYEAVKGIIGELGLPIIMDCDIGHVAPMMPLINGAYACVEYTDGKLTIDFSRSLFSD